MPHVYTMTCPAMRSVFPPHWKHEEAWNKNSDQFYQFLAHSLIIIHTAFLGWWNHCVLWSILMNISGEPATFTFRLSPTVEKKHIAVTLCHQHTKHTFRNKFFGNLLKWLCNIQTNTYFLRDIFNQQLTQHTNEYCHHGTWTELMRCCICSFNGHVLQYYNDKLTLYCQPDSISYGSVIMSSILHRLSICFTAVSYL